jgi:hypothetical protein
MVASGDGVLGCGELGSRIKDVISHFFKTRKQCAALPRICFNIPVNKY